jgi:16S rRNA processing protein RimM
VRKAHGIRGELAIEIMTDSPDEVFSSGSRVFAGTVDGEIAASRQELHVASVRPQGDGFLMRFEEIADRTAAELWRGRYMLLPRNELPALEEDELYLHELPGMEVHLADGTKLGTVDAWYELPQGVAIDVRRAGTRNNETVMLLYDDATIQSVDRERRIIVVTPPDGLLDE